MRFRRVDRVSRRETMQPQSSHRSRGSIFMPRVATRENFGKRRLASLLPQGLEALNRSGDLGCSTVHFRDYAGDRFAVPGDANGAAALHFVQKLRPLGFGL